MCGICGIVATAGADLHGDTSSRVDGMLSALDHRGPDDRGAHATAIAVLGATRLAIRGLHDGHQPFVDEATGVLVVCNGEIDNHQELRTWLAERGRPVVQATDVAILPGLYLELGAAFVERLVGAFAIALWDPRAGELLLARDRAGERPVFFSLGRGQALFATEMAALAGVCPLVPDRLALERYLRSGSFTAPASPIVGVEKVGPGEVVTISALGVSRRRYWRWGERSGVSAPPVAVTPARFDAVFRRAVRRQTDVEAACGVFLSGGLDSSLVAAVARAERPEMPLKAFTLRFAEESYDEGAFAARVADRLGLETTEVWVRAGDLPRLLPGVVRLAGEPLADPAWVPTAMLAQRAAEDVKVALVGEGGDEAFGGYPTYIGAWLGERWSLLPGPVKRALRGAVHRLPASERKVTVGALLRRFVDGAELGGLERHLFWTASVPPDVLAALGLDRPERARTAPAMPAMPITPPTPAIVWPEILDVVQRHDFESSLAEGLLTKADRASMKHAVELRAPFLDRDVLELAGSLPAGQRVRGFETKAFLKEYARGYLPRSIVDRRKRGLSLPLARWLRGPLCEWAEDRLGAGLLAQVGIETAPVLDLWDQHRRRRADHARPLWTLLVLVEWLDWIGEQGAG